MEVFEREKFAEQVLDCMMLGMQQMGFIYSWEIRRICPNCETVNLVDEHCTKCGLIPEIEGI